MCYATSLTKSKKEIEETFNRDFAVPLEYQKHYHLNGFGSGMLHIIPMETDRIYPSSWGLIPEYAFEDPAGFKADYNTLNARRESIFSSRTYKKSAAESRCLIIADGFYEPHHYKSKSQPYYCKLEGHQLFAFAGLCTELDDELYSASIITLPANELFAQIHNKKKRMPLVLDNLFLDSWIESGLNQKQVEELMRVGFTNTPFETYPVSNAIYKRGVETDLPGILEPVQPLDPALGGGEPTLF